MHFLVISTPRAEQPSAMRDAQIQWWDWINALKTQGVAKQVYTKLGRGAVVIFEVDAHETMHKLVNQWNEHVPATFEVEALLPGEHQEKIARARVSPLAL
jgi:muconolactone delta-isomerase